MLVLTRQVGESIQVDGPCVIKLNWIKGSRVAIGVEADRSVKILRTELQLDKLEEATEPEGSQECGEPRAA